MKLIWKSDDGKSCVVKFTQKELKTVKTLLVDNYFDMNFEYHDVSKPKSIDYLFIQKNEISVNDCLDYLKLCFANEVINSTEKPKKSKNDITKR